MKRWRVVHFHSAEEVEDYLNGLSIEPEQVKGVFAHPPSTADSAGSVVLVCWLNAHQQRVEQLQKQDRSEEDLAPPLKREAPPAAQAPESPPASEPRRTRRREEDER